VRQQAKQRAGVQQADQVQLRRHAGQVAGGQRVGRAGRRLQPAGQRGRKARADARVAHEAGQAGDRRRGDRREARRRARALRDRLVPDGRAPLTTCDKLASVRVPMRALPVDASAETPSHPRYG